MGSNHAVVGHMRLGIASGPGVLRLLGGPVDPGWVAEHDPGIHRVQSLTIAGSKSVDRNIGRARPQSTQVPVAAPGMFSNRLSMAIVQAADHASKSARAWAKACRTAELNSQNRTCRTGGLSGSARRTVLRAIRAA